VGLELVVDSGESERGNIIGRNSFRVLDKSVSDNLKFDNLKSEVADVVNTVADAVTTQIDSDIVTMLRGWQWRNIDIKVVIFVGRIGVEVLTTRMFLLNGYVSRLARDEDVLCTVTLRVLINN